MGAPVSIIVKMTIFIELTSSLSSFPIMLGAGVDQWLELTGSFRARVSHGGRHGRTFSSSLSALLNRDPDTEPSLAS